MPSVIMRSFAGGEISPALFARADQTKYQTGLKTCRNFIVQRFGGIANRPGTKFVCATKSNGVVRLVKFVFNAEQTYILEFGDLYMRVIKNGVQLGAPYEIVTPYTAAQVRDLQFVQSADVLTIVHPAHQPRELSRLGDTNWALSLVVTAPSLAAPGSVTATAGTPATTATTPGSVAATGGTGGAAADEYRVSSWDVGTGSESIASVSVVSSSGANYVATSGNPITVTWGAVGAAEGYSVYKKPGGGSAFGLIGVVPAGTLSLVDNGLVPADMVALAPDAATGTSTWRYQVTAAKAETYEESIASATATCTGSTPTDAAPNVVTWAAVTGAAEYYVYRERNGVYGYIGTATGTTFSDTNFAPDLTDTPPQARLLFDTAGNYPQAVSYTQQRLCFGGTDSAPEKVWMSRTGNFKNFSYRSPLQDDDAVTFTIAGRQVNEVRHLVEIDRLLVLTSGGEWMIQGGGDGVISPTTINLKQIGYSGASTVAPVVIGNSALFIQARGGGVRDLRFEQESDGYNGRDLTVYAPHLFDGHSLVAWDYAQMPNSIVWAVRDDGTLVALTYLREHEIWGWHRHDTGDGDAFEDVAVVPEGSEDAVYVVVRRTVNGATVRYIERFASRYIESVADDARFVDSHLTYDGTNTTATTLTLTGGAGWTHTEDLTLAASAATFTAGDVGNAFDLTIGADTVTCRVLSFINATAVIVQANKTVPVSLRGIATATWSRAADEFSGLGHLEGRTVSILADGDVHPQRVVASGAVTLDRPYSKVVVGLPITAEAETLPLESLQGETLTDKKKRVNKVTLMLDASRGGFVGQGGDSGALMRELPQRTSASANGEVPLVSGTEEINISTQWDATGGVLIRQTDPLPLTVLAVVPSGIIAN